MTRVVLDTNVFVSSFFGGHPRAIVDLWARGEVVLCLSAPIVDEYVRVLRRLGLQGERELEELLALFARGYHVLFTAKTPKLQVVAGDPDDDKFIECAVALKAGCVISGDRRLTAVHDYMGIAVLSPRDFIDRYGRREP